MKNNTSHLPIKQQARQAMDWVRKRKGSLLILVLILTTGIMMGLGTALKYGLNEKRINERHILRQQAKNAAESMVEYGFADLIERFRNKSAVGLVKSSLSSDPVVIPSTATAFFASSHIDLSKSELIVGEIPTYATEVYIDPKDPTNEYDPLKGKRAYVRRIEVLGKATATSTTGGGIEISAYARQVLEVRDSPLFAHAMFYNMDLELHPGPKMDIYGPVHSNDNFWVQAVNGLKFHETVAASGRILHGNKGGSINANGTLKSSGQHDQSASVQIKNSQGVFKDMYNSGGDKGKDSGWLDSRDPYWRSKASQRWDGFVQDSSHGVPDLNPVGIDDFVPLDQSVKQGAQFNPSDATSPINVIDNHAYALIEPVLAEGHPNYKGDSVRKEKFAYKAGLILKVEKTGSGAHPYYVGGYSNSDAGQSLTPVRNEYQVKAYKYSRDSNGDPLIDSTTGYPKMIEVRLPDGLIGAADDTLRNIETDGVLDPYMTSTEVTEKADFLADPDKIMSNDYTPTSGTVEGGMYDHREDKALDMLTLNVNRLRELVDDTDSNYAPSDWNTHYGPGAEPTENYTPSSDWNGVVYVEFPVNTDTMSTSALANVNISGVTQLRYDDIVTGSDPFTALQMVNADKFPSPSYAKEKGLTLATNAPLYTVGNVNADGSKHSNDANMPDNSSEPPGAVISDSLTVLSNRWYPDSSNNHKYSNQSNTSNRKALYTEFSAAILTGLKPTVPSGSPNMPNRGASSGGAHNFPRFLEKWSDDLTIRGSLVALFESEVHKLAMPSNHSHYYSPPTRDWGFNDNFRNGNYPPGTPNTRTYRRVFMQDLPQKTVGTSGSADYVEGYVDAVTRINASGS